MIAAARFLCARAGSHRVAFAVEDVQEVQAPRALTRLFHVSEAILGVVNLRGELLPVVDLARLLGERSAHGSPDARLLVLRVPVGPKPTPLAVHVDALDPLADARADALTGLPEGLPQSTARFGRAVLRRGSGEGALPGAVVLDVGSIAAAEELLVLRA